MKSWLNHKLFTPGNGTYKNRKTTVLSMCWAFLSIKISSWKSLSFFVEMSHFEIVSPFLGQEVEKKPEKRKLKTHMHHVFRLVVPLRVSPLKFNGCFAVKNRKYLPKMGRFYKENGRIPRMCLFLCSKMPNKEQALLKNDVCQDSEFECS